MAPQRLCESCVGVIQKVREFEAAEGVVWGELSDRGRRWLQDSNALRLQSSARISFTEYQTKTPDPADEEMIQKDVLSGRSDPSTLDLELRELLAWVDLSHYRSTISTVLRAYCVRNPQIGYCQGLNYVTAWLLVFMDAGSAFWVLCNLIERVLTPGFYLGARTGNSLNGFYIESTVVAALLDYYFPVIREHILPVTDFSDCFSLPLLIQLFINSLDLSATLFLWDCLFLEGSAALVRGVISLAYISEPAIRAGSHPSSIHRELNSTRVYPVLKLLYPNIKEQVTVARVERLRKQARDYRAYQWLGNKQMVMRRLEFATKFTSQELAQFQREFNAVLAAKRVTEDQTRVRALSGGRKNTVTLPGCMQAEISTLEGTIDIGITKEEFFTLLQQLSGRLLSHSERLFDLFDEDKSGYLDFRELAVCMSVLWKGSFEDRLRLFFDVYDLDRSGCLRKADFQQLLYAVSLPYYEVLADKFDREVKRTVEAVYVRLNPLCGGGLVTWLDFVTAVKGDERVGKCFEEHVSVKIKAPDASIQSIHPRPKPDKRHPQRTATCVQCLLM